MDRKNLFELTMATIFCTTAKSMSNKGLTYGVHELFDKCIQIRKSHKLDVTDDYIDQAHHSKKIRGIYLDKYNSKGDISEKYFAISKYEFQKNWDIINKADDAALKWGHCKKKNEIEKATVLEWCK